MRQPNIVPYNAEGAVIAYTVVKGGASGGVVQAAAATDKLLGLATDIAAATSENCDVIVDGPALAKSGGTVAIGDLLTSDASGNVIVAAPGTGVNNRIVGQALEAAASGDIFRIFVAIGSLQG